MDGLFAHVLRRAVRERRDRTRGGNGGSDIVEYLEETYGGAPLPAVTASRSSPP
ncbi:hypothetical protein LC1Hm_0280 [Halomicrobium sp. LC1Hm]|nr:hypothetical protein LC1Hm_0280 [Halomicrobium sp. LC1Hm]